MLQQVTLSDIENAIAEAIHAETGAVVWVTLDANREEWMIDGEFWHAATAADYLNAAGYPTQDAIPTETGMYIFLSKERNHAVD